MLFGSLLPLVAAGAVLVRRSLPAPPMAAISPAVPETNVVPEKPTEPAPPVTAPSPATKTRPSTVKPNGLALMAEASVIDPQLTASSWENPFEERYWSNTGWKLTSENMTAEVGTTATATFRRAYKHLNLEFELQALKDPPVDPLEVRLESPVTQSVTRIRLQPPQTELGVSVRQEWDFIRTKTLNPPISSKQPRNLRIVATGNRLHIIWQDRSLFLEEQVAEQSGKDVLLTLHAPQGGYRFTRVRVEGD